MVTREQIVGRLAMRRVSSHYIPNMSRALIRQAAQGITNAQWDAIISAIKGADTKTIGDVLRAEVLKHLKALAVADIEAALSPDDALTISELEALL